MRSLSQLTVLLVAVGCGSSPPPATVVFPPVDIATPPSGSLSDAQLETIRSDIEELRASPLGDGADEGRRALFEWLSASPDVSVNLCADVIGPFSESANEHNRFLFLQYALHLAEHAIEEPGASDDALNLVAMERTLDTYEAVVSARGRRARSSFLDDLVERREDGELEAFVSDAMRNC